MIIELKLNRFKEKLQCNTVYSNVRNITPHQQYNNREEKQKKTVCERRNNFSGKNPCTNVTHYTSPTASLMIHAHTTKPLESEGEKNSSFGQSLTMFFFRATIFF